MARLAGTSGKVWFDVDDGGTFGATEYMLGVTKWSLTDEADVLETTGMDSAGKASFIGGVTRFSGSITVNYDDDATNVQPEGRKALVALAIILGVTTVPPHWLVLRHRPQDMGLLPDGETVEVGRPLPPLAGVTAERATRDPAYWWLSVAFFLGTAASVAIGLYLIPVLLERGDSMAQATSWFVRLSSTTSTCRGGSPSWAATSASTGAVTAGRTRRKVEP